MALSLCPPGIPAGFTKSLGWQKELSSTVGLVVVSHTVHTYTYHEPLQPGITSVTSFGTVYFPPHPICCPFLAGDSGGGHSHSKSLPKLSPRKGCGQPCHDKLLSPKYKSIKKHSSHSHLQSSPTSWPHRNTLWVTRFCTVPVWFVFEPLRNSDI